MANESITKGIFIAIAVVFAISITQLAFAGIRTGKNMITPAEMEEYTSYIGETITGSQVLSLISQWSQYPISVKVKTKGNTGGLAYNYKSTGNELGAEIPAATNANQMANARKKGDANYINPNANFVCSCTPDKNGSYSVIVFEQQ